RFGRGRVGRQRGQCLGDRVQVPARLFAEQVEHRVIGAEGERLRRNVGRLERGQGREGVRRTHPPAPSLQGGGDGWHRLLRFVSRDRSWSAFLPPPCREGGRGGGSLFSPLGQRDERRVQRGDRRRVVRLPRRHRFLRQFR